MGAKLVRGKRERERLKRRCKKSRDDGKSVRAPPPASQPAPEVDYAKHGGAHSLLGMLLLQGLLCREGDKILPGESLSKRQQQREIPRAITKLKIDHLPSLRREIPRQKNQKKVGGDLACSGVHKAKGESELAVRESFSTGFLPLRG